MFAIVLSMACSVFAGTGDALYKLIAKNSRAVSYSATKAYNSQRTQQQPQNQQNYYYSPQQTQRYTSYDNSIDAQTSRLRKYNEEQAQRRQDERDYETRKREEKADYYSRKAESEWEETQYQLKRNNKSGAEDAAWRFRKYNNESERLRRY